MEATFEKSVGVVLSRTHSSTFSKIQRIRPSSRQNVLLYRHPLSATERFGLADPLASPVVLDYELQHLKRWKAICTAHEC
jgi:hypothetical protein